MNENGVIITPWVTKDREREIVCKVATTRIVVMSIVLLQQRDLEKLMPCNQI